MLLCGIQKMGLDEGHITLFDEVELGLEPHRITRLIKHIREDKRGQYFLTTHSPTVLRELTIDELYVVHRVGGVTQVIPAAKKGLEQHELQGKVRSSSDAFLAKKIIVCEGATEVGFLRGFDDYQVENKKDPLSYHGVALLDVIGGSKVKPIAKAFKALHYEVSALADGDADDQFSEADARVLRELEIPVFMWSDKLSLEERAFQDVPWEFVLLSLYLARDTLNYSVRDQVLNKFEGNLEKELGHWEDSPELRKAIGIAAKKSNWFKDITRGDLWFKTIKPAFEDAGFAKTDLSIQLTKLWKWVEHV
ncbi:ATP-dependent endonuclease [Pseudomonas sp. L13]|nr:TOPRIM nucleotidyl transferase/hydrolase domain-containing protein [Pseudomonas sp. L13]NCE89599.1 hypothetical protein [Pseudomonas sp. L13]